MSDMEASDPRLVLDALLTERGVGYAALSRMIGRHEAYLQQFIKRGTPRAQAEHDRRLLADILRDDDADAEPGEQPDGRLVVEQAVDRAADRADRDHETAGERRLAGRAAGHAMPLPRPVAGCQRPRAGRAGQDRGRAWKGVYHCHPPISVDPPSWHAACSSPRVQRWEFSMSFMPFLADRRAIADADTLIAMFGDEAGLEAAARADHSRDVGNPLLRERFKELSTLAANDGAPANAAQLDRRAREDAALLVGLLRAQGYNDDRVTSQLEPRPGFLP